jgi:hypothetical protein
MIPFRFEYLIERLLREQDCAEQRLLKELAGVTLSAAAARAEWPRVLEHKWYVSERLGRDIGPRAAAVDYFENVRLPRNTRTGQKAHAARGLHRLAQTHNATA